MRTAYQGTKGAQISGLKFYCAGGGKEAPQKPKVEGARVNKRESKTSGKQLENLLIVVEEEEKETIH